MSRILIVDDDESERLLQQAILERAGHQIFLASDGEEAVREYLAQGIDLVITDLQMPEIHGLALITLLRGLDPRPPIIAISGTGAPQLDMAQAIGADETLSKPVEPVELLNAVEQLVPSAPQ